MIREKKTDELDLLKLKTSALQKTLLMKRQTTDWEIYLQNPYLIKDYIQNTQRTLKTQQ